MKGSSVTPRPSVVINFRSYSTGCEKPVMCAVNIADTGLQQGQGMHGSFNRADTMNFMAAAGPDFKSGFINDAPVSNADIGKTIAQVLGLKIPFHGCLMGRVVEEALPGGASPTVEQFVRTRQTGRKRPRDGAGWPARRQHAIFRRGRFPGPNCRYGRTQGRKPLMLLRRRAEKSFSTRRPTPEVFVLRKRDRPPVDTLPPTPYSTCRRHLY